VQYGEKTQVIAPVYFRPRENRSFIPQKQAENNSKCTFAKISLGTF
jgi:hypothetical protein